MCKYCEHENNDFVPLNQTVDYSGIEMSLSRQGVLRIRYYKPCEHPSSDDILCSQDFINVKFCPICGRKFNI